MKLFLSKWLKMVLCVCVCVCWWLNMHRPADTHTENLHTLRSDAGHLYHIYVEEITNKNVYFSFSPLCHTSLTAATIAQYVGIYVVAVAVVVATTFKLPLTSTAGENRESERERREFIKFTICKSSSIHSKMRNNKQHQATSRTDRCNIRDQHATAA